MIKWVLRRAIDKFEREWNYDASYIRDMIDASPRAAWLFSRVTALGPGKTTMNKLLRAGDVTTVVCLKLLLIDEYVYK